MTAEGAIQQQILEYLDLMGIFRWRNNTGVARMGSRRVPFGKKGSSDILGVLKPSGRFLAIEVKAPGAQPTIEQIAFLRMVRDAGGVAIVAESIEDVRRVLFPLTKKG